MPDIRAIALGAALLTGSVAVGSKPASAGDSQGVVAESLSDNLVGRATIDGAKVLGVHDVSGCVTEFTTASGHPTIAWSKVDDPQVRYDGLYMILPVQQEGSTSELRIPRGPNANRVRSSFTLLYLECHPK